MNGRDQPTPSFPLGIEQNFIPMQANPYFIAYPPQFVQPQWKKLFVGQIPKTMNEQDVIQIFSDSFFIQNAYIIKDRNTHEHKGCAFIFVDPSVSDALIEKYHNKYKCDGMANALQVKYANTASQYHKDHPFSAEPKANEFVPQDAQNPLPMMPMYTFPFYSFYPSNMMMNYPSVSSTSIGSEMESGVPRDSTPVQYYYQPVFNGVQPETGTEYPTQSNTPIVPESKPVEKANSHTNFSSNSNLFVYNFSPTFSDSDLLKMFSPFGTVISAKVIRDRTTGASKGYGFVNFRDAREAEKAIAAMNGKKVDGRELTVQIKKVKK
ncbi:hypothetical protein WA171_002155, partial [Blastocystis sp. BT1]